jgi:hypothetical protein
MTTELGPHVQMATLAERMATCYQKDANLALKPLLAHYMDEVEINIASDRFNHLGFINRIRTSLALAAASAAARRSEFLHAVIVALEKREQSLENSLGTKLGSVSSA